jgi:hypothetical protein
VATIETNKDLVTGYVAVEFSGPRAFTGTDFVGSKLIFLNDDNDIVGNRPLKEYLTVHREDSYVLEIGNAPFTPKKPIHVVAAGSTPFSVNKVTLFEK